MEGLRHGNGIEGGKRTLYCTLWFIICNKRRGGGGVLTWMGGLLVVSHSTEIITQKTATARSGNSVDG